MLNLIRVLVNLIVYKISGVIPASFFYNQNFPAS